MFVQNAKANPVRVCTGVLLLATHLSFGQTADPALPLDDYLVRTVMDERTPLPYQPVREADVAYERRIWRVIDLREKMNLPLASPQAPLIGVLEQGILSGELPVYSTEDDRFSRQLTPEEARAAFVKRDTIFRINIDTGEEEMVAVENHLNGEDVKRFRVKEAWFFDSRTSSLQVRILGIAPVLDVYNESGDFVYEQPMFWVHYPTARPFLARQKATLMNNNLAATASFEDLFEQRLFASTVVKENNPYNRRLQDYLAGEALLTEAQKIQQGIFNWEQDLWSY